MLNVIRQGALTVGVWETLLTIEGFSSQLKVTQNKEEGKDEEKDENKNRISQTSEKRFGSNGTCSSCETERSHRGPIYIFDILHMTHRRFLKQACRPVRSVPPLPKC